ncbi:glutamate-5-semialdehyde dehydrogenase [Bartonella sp. HY329]|nr:MULTISPECIES: glutamate-5-semialdehyde dehydrogenase [unclassified Bartonella]UXM95570.1 glutamate-5-semialdehyde dehydrogenase [Bartonella sp. HY329]UXN09895.1 glutamate-5-semialdehyde dehydrogenase [Bartonella sp. HY328]
MPDHHQNHDIARAMLDMGVKARQAQRRLKSALPEQKTTALKAIADEISNNCQAILAANQLDIEQGTKAGMSAAMLDRLRLDEKRIANIADSVRMISNLPDPVGSVIDEWDRPNGLHIQRVRTPLGVIGVIYESRPNVTADAAALCLKAGNCVILRGGSDSFHSSNAIYQAIKAGLLAAGLPQNAVQMVETTDRAAVGEMLKGLNGAIDVIVPRGGKSLVKRVQDEARVPVFAHLEGICHIYIDKSADKNVANEVVLNAKMRRTGICGAVETLLVDRDFDMQALIAILNNLVAKGCEIRGSTEILQIFDKAVPASDEDWSTEYLDAILSVRFVDGIDEAIDHIEHYSSHHTEAIIAEDPQIVETFFNGIDSAILIHNASTQFADGGEFGFGAEIGIATGKMHARGPIGVEQLTSFQYHVLGKGQIRP